MIPPVTWEWIQQEAQQILSSGVHSLTKNIQPTNLVDIKITRSGNYYIYSNKDSYIGEANNIRARVRQQFSPSTSTFYKNYKKVNISGQDLYGILEFKINIMATNIGRKEIEEFGIVNIPTTPNKFQLGKRNVYKIDQHNGLWASVQDNYLKCLNRGKELVLGKGFIPWPQCGDVERPGIYLVKSKHDGLIYVGESSDISERHRTHSGRTYFSALRRHIGTELLGFRLKVIDGKARYFSDDEDVAVDKYLSSCAAIFYEVQIGRYELEDTLIKQLNPILNRKGKVA